MSSSSNSNHMYSGSTTVPTFNNTTNILQLQDHTPHNQRQPPHPWDYHSQTLTTNNHPFLGVATPYVVDYQSQPPSILPPTNTHLASYPFYVDDQTTTTTVKNEADHSSWGRIGLNLGYRTYFSSGDAAAIDRLFRRSRGIFPISHPVPQCQAEGCKADLSGARHYHRRHKVCEFHSKATIVIAAGLQQRFCQQCSRFHVLSEFDDAKRSCRKRLADHNRRRRKPQPVTTVPITGNDNEENNESNELGAESKATTTSNSSNSVQNTTTCSNGAMGGGGTLMSSSTSSASSMMNKEINASKAQSSKVNHLREGGVVPSLLSLGDRHYHHQTDPLLFTSQAQYGESSSHHRRHYNDENDDHFNNHLQFSSSMPSSFFAPRVQSNASFNEGSASHLGHGLFELDFM